MSCFRYEYLFIYSVEDEITLRTYDNLSLFLKSKNITNYDVKLVNAKQEPEWLFKYNILALPAVVQLSPGPGFTMTGDISIDDFKKIQPPAYS